VDRHLCKAELFEGHGQDAGCRARRSRRYDPVLATTLLAYTLILIIDIERAPAKPIIPCVLRRFMTMPPRSAQNDANQAHIAADLHQTGSAMSNIRTTNKRAKRAIVLNIARNKPAAAPVVEAAEPAKAAS
jgi:hypothetical protein